jgi:hypothetical protein
MIRRGERGSVFVEAMIAAAIVAVALAAAYRVIGQGAVEQHAVEARRAALLVAQSELDAVGAEIPLEAGSHAGLSGDMVWRVDMEPYEDGGDPNIVGALWRVVVSVRPQAGGEALVTLRSLRLGRKA